LFELLLRTFVKDYKNTGDAAVRERYGVFSGCTGIALNVLLCVGKFIAGAITGAVSITADAFNNLSDAASSVVTLAGFKLAARKADEDHPYGHGRMEYLAGLAVSVVILLVGLELLKSAVEKILRPEAVTFSWLSVGILTASILVKLWMYLFNRDLGRRIGSAAMGATAADSLSDCVATAAVLAGLLVSHFAQISIDGWVGVLVALFVLRAGWEAVKDTVDPLLGQAPDPALVQGIHDTVLAHPEILGLHDLMVHDYGPSRVIASLHAEVDLRSDMAETHDLIDNIERELGQKYQLMATIHMDPVLVGDERTDACKAEMLALAQTIHPEIGLHDFRMVDGPTHCNLIFDLVVPHACPLTDAQVKERMAALIREKDPRCIPVIQIDHAYAL